jgi:hypothetical protein
MLTPLQIQIQKPHTFKRYFQFCVNNEVVGVLNFDKPFCYKATASFGESQWTFKISGFFKRFLEVTAQQSPYTKSRVKLCWNHKLTFTTDERNSWFLKPVGFWKRSWSWLNDKNEPVIQLKSNSFSKNNRGEVLLQQPVNKESFLLILIAWIQVIVSEDEAASG